MRPSTCRAGWVIGAILFCGCVSATSAQEIKKGEFETFFTERSPLSAKDALLKRLNEKPTDSDYDLSKEAFRLYVPENYDPANTYGIIYWLGYKGAGDAPPKWKPLLDQHRLIFITARASGQPDWVRAGLALDAVHNLQTTYKIDAARVYLFGDPQPPGIIPQQIAMSAPDVFTGSLIVNFIHYFRLIPVAGTTGIQPKFSPPPAALLAQAKTRRHVLAIDPGSKPAAGKFDWFTLIYHAYQQDGFKNVMTLDLSSLEDTHYPNLTEPWLEQSLAFLDAPQPASAALKPAADDNNAARKSAPSTRPAIPEPQRLLNLARTYIAAKSYANARTRLQDLIAKYPNDPAAKEAKLLLDQIKNQ